MSFWDLYNRKVMTAVRKLETAVKVSEEVYAGKQLGLPRGRVTSVGSCELSWQP
jgi:hypothetical protein